MQPYVKKILIMRFELEFLETVSGRYILDLPKDYQDRSKWPLVVFLHGYGESGDDLELVKTHGPPKLAAEGREFPFFLISLSVHRAFIGDR